MTNREKLYLTKREEVKWSNLSHTIKIEVQNDSGPDTNQNQRMRIEFIPPLLSKLVVHYLSALIDKSSIKLLFIILFFPLSYFAIYLIRVPLN